MSEASNTGLLTQAVRSSRYKNHKILELNTTRFQETWRPPDIEASSQDQVYRVDPGKRWRLDLLARDVYGDQGLWWVIALANNIVDPFRDLNTTTEPIFIRIPPRATVFAKVLR